MNRARYLRRLVIYLEIYWLYRNVWRSQKWFDGRKSTKRMSVGMCFPMCSAAFQRFVNSVQHDIFRNLGKPYHVMSAPRWGEVWYIESCYIFERTCNAVRLPIYHDGMWSALTIKETYKLSYFLTAPWKLRIKTPLRDQKNPEELYEYIQYIYVCSQFLCFIACFGHAFNGFRTDRRGNRRICMKNAILLTILCGASMTQHCADHQNISEHPTMCNR